MKRTSIFITGALALLFVPKLADATPVVELAPVVSDVTERPDGVTVEWTVPEAVASEAVLYEVTAALETEDEQTDGTVVGHAIVASDVRSASINGLDAEDDYSVQVQPVTATGRSTASEPVPAALDAEGPAATVASAPADVAVAAGAGAVGVDAGKVHVSWGPAVDNGSPVVAYSVAAFEDESIVAFRSVGPDGRSATLTGLTDGGDAEVWVFAWTALGMGEIATVDTEPGSGEPLAGGPVVPWAAAWDLGSLSVVTWGAADEAQEPVTGYDVIVLIDGVFKDWHQTGPNARQLALAAVEEGTTVEVYVFAHGATTLGPLGELIEISAPVDVVIEDPGEGGSTDGGSTDGGSTDGGSTDGGSTDGGSTDGGSTDGGSTDGGSTDGGSTDGGTGVIPG